MRYTVLQHVTLTQTVEADSESAAIDLAIANPERFEPLYCPSTSDYEVSRVGFQGNGP